MGFSYTALQLVNRVHRRRRMPDVGAFSETEDLATLDAVNSAIETVLSSKRWEFDMRRAQIVLKGRKTGGTIDVTSPTSLNIDYTNSDGVDDGDVYSLTGDGVRQYIIRVMPTGSDEYGNTGFRVQRASGSGGTTAVLSADPCIPVVMDDVAATLFYAEYILPDTVRNVLRVTHQERTLTLDQVDPVVEFEELYPQPQIEFGEPERVSVGGFDLYTYEASGDAPSPGLRMIIWPVPDDEYVLDYTYHYRHPELVDVTDTLDGVPPDVVDLIVDTAATDMKAYFEKDYEALRLAMLTSSRLERIHQRQGGMYADRKPIGNWDGSAGAGRGDFSLLRGRTVGS